MSRWRFSVPEVAHKSMNQLPTAMKCALHGIMIYTLTTLGCSGPSAEEEARGLLKRYMLTIETTTVGGQPEDNFGWSKHRYVPLEADYDFRVTKSVNRPFRASAKVLYRYEFADSLLHPLKSRGGADC